MRGMWRGEQVEWHINKKGVVGGDGPGGEGGRGNVGFKGGEVEVVVGPSAFNVEWNQPYSIMKRIEAKFKPDNYAL